MSKKIIFVGPSGAGKTTLRKIFFEGENVTKLLEYALEPTYGEESLILRLPGLNEDIGVFDLAGQENERWLETEDKSIFCNTKVILVIIDITLELDRIIDFIKKIILIRDELTPITSIYVLMHKIDLVTQNTLTGIKNDIFKNFPDKKRVEFKFTSLKKQYFSQTFTDFIDIMKTIMVDNESEDGLMFNLIDESLKLVNHIDSEIAIAKVSLKEKINIPENLLNYLVEHLVNKGHVEITNTNNLEILSLTEKGKDHFKSIINNFTADPNIDTVNNILIANGKFEAEPPPFIGALVSDKSGKLLLRIDADGILLEKFLGIDNQEDKKLASFEIELIPMFISALGKFSSEININDLTGFNLKGSNLKMEIYNYNDYTVIIFMNPKVNLTPINSEINNFFVNLLEEYKDEFKIAKKKGNVEILFPLEDLGKKWLQDLSNSYTEMVINFEIFDYNQAKILYSKFDDDLYYKIETDLSFALEKIKKLKINLVKAILEKDDDEFKKITKLAQQLSSKYVT